MKKAVIWDLDGTLFDSYDVIVNSLSLTFQEYGIKISREDIHHHAISFSIRSLLSKISDESGVPTEDLHQRYSLISSNQYLAIKPMPHAMEVLQNLEDSGVESYVFTHRGKTTIPVLDNLGMTRFFKEIITSQSGFPRKPDPQGLYYLISKYDLSKEYTYYVGDRSIDMDCAKNAGISGILFLPEGCIDVSGGSEKYIVKDLLEILSII